MGKSAFWNNKRYLKDDIAEAINELNSWGILKDGEAEKCIQKALLNPNLVKEEYKGKIDYRKVNNSEARILAD